jgi:hypothetical protein
MSLQSRGNHGHLPSAQALSSCVTDRSSIRTSLGRSNEMPVDEHILIRWAPTDEDNISCRRRAEHWVGY